VKTSILKAKACISSTILQKEVTIRILQVLLEFAVCVFDVFSQQGRFVPVVITFICVADVINVRKFVSGALNGSNIAIVRVHTRQDGPARSDHVGDSDRSLGLARAVSARTVELAKVLSAVRVDDDITASVMLNDLVISILGSTPGDCRCSRGLLDGDGIFANILEPDIPQSARAQAVDTLRLVCADNNILQSSALLKQENGVAIASLFLPMARSASPIKADISTIERLSSGDSSCSAERRRLWRGGESAAGRKRLGLDRVRCGKVEEEGDGKADLES